MLWIVAMAGCREASEASLPAPAAPKKPDDTVAVRVVDAGGRPVSGAFVGVVDAQDSNSPIYAWAEGRAPKPAIADDWARSDASGAARVAVEGLEADVVAIGDGVLGHRWIAGWTESVTTIRVAPPRHLKVRVVDDGGRPLAGVPIVAEKREFMWDTTLPCGDEAARATDSDGVADLGAVNLHFDPDQLDEKFEVRPTFPERVRSRIQVDVAHLPDQPISLRVRPTGRLEIAVVNADDRPLEHEGEISLFGSQRRDDRLDLSCFSVTVTGGRAILERVGAGWSSDQGLLALNGRWVQLSGSIPPVRAGETCNVSLRVPPEDAAPTTESTRPEMPQATEVKRIARRHGARLATRLWLDPGVAVGYWEIILTPPELHDLPESFSCWNGGIDDGAHRVVLTDRTPGTYDLVVTEPLGEGRRGEVARVAGVQLSEGRLTVLPPIDLRGRLHVTRLHLRDEAGHPIESGFVHVPDLLHDRGPTIHVDDGEAILASAGPIGSCEIDCGAARITRITPIDGDQTLVLKAPYRVHVVMNEALRLPPSTQLRLRLRNSNPGADYIGNGYDAPLDRSGEITIATISSPVIEVREATKYWFEATLLSDRRPNGRGVSLLDPGLGLVAFHVPEGEDQPTLRFAIGQSVIDEAAAELK